MSRASKGRKVREKILSAATSVFSEMGYRGTTTRRIAEEAEVPLGSLHYHFGNKERLYVAVVEWIFAQEAKLILDIEREIALHVKGDADTNLQVSQEVGQEASQENGSFVFDEWSPAERLGRFLDMWIDFMFENPEMARMGLYGVVEYGALDFPTGAPTLFRAGSFVAETLARTLHAPSEVVHTLEAQTRILAASDLVAGFVGGATHHAKALGLDPVSTLYRSLVKDTVRALLVPTEPLTTTLEQAGERSSSLPLLPEEKSGVGEKTEKNS